MKLFINFVILVVVFSVLDATEITEEDIRMFLPFMIHRAPPPCPLNEIYRQCTGKCSDCVQRGMCVVSECEEGCDCKPHFYRVTPDGPCEPVAKCPIPECGENETFRECGPVCETCTTMECHIISCDHKCYCKDGYLRNKEGTCIPKEECPTRTQCTETEVWAESGLPDKYCWHKADADMSNTTVEDPKCYCEDGFRRNLLGYCVNETICPLLKCLGNEMYHKCIPKCNTTCRNYGNPNCTEDDNCYPGCFCPPGYVMNDLRSCVEVDKCSSEIQKVTVIHTVKSESSTTLTTNDTSIADDSTPENDTTITDDSIPVNDTTITDDSAAANYTTEADTEEIEEGAESSVTTDGQILTSPTPTPTSATTVSGTTAKEKYYKKDKETKHENIAKEKDTVKYEFEEDEDGFGNDNI